MKEHDKYNFFFLFSIQLRMFGLCRWIRGGRRRGLVVAFLFGFILVRFVDHLLQWRQILLKDARANALLQGTPENIFRYYLPVSISSGCLQVFCILPILRWWFQWPRLSLFPDGRTAKHPTDRRIKQIFYYGLLSSHFYGLMIMRTLKFWFRHF